MADAPFTMGHVARFEDTIVDARADLTALDLILEVAVPDDDDSETLGLVPDPDFHRVVMTVDVHRALLRAVKHLRGSVISIHAQFGAGAGAAMMRGAE